MIALSNVIIGIILGSFVTLCLIATLLKPRHMAPTKRRHAAQEMDISEMGVESAYPCDTRNGSE